MKSISTVLWFLILSSMLTGWVALIFAFNKETEPMAGAVSLVAAALAFGLPAVALFNSLKK
ncbi:MAG: hypothetical protein OEM81_02075 [Acidimicrobiia bacterium]|nr:hypothetical protein [Acidimicrobiia bacterium]MDH3396599.1 hypothetical protein [Acidimicrobiia bacterium]